MKRTLPVMALCLLLTGCQSLIPQWRVFQKKVPEPIVKTDSQREIDRQAADYIARTVETPPGLKPIAASLSESLGHPAKPIKVTDDSEAKLQAMLAKALLQTQRERDELNTALTKTEGKKIEGTGYNVFGFAISGTVILVIALCVMFPPLAGIIWWIIQRAYGALSRTTAGIGKFMEANPDGGEQLKAFLSKTHDSADKNIIKKIKAKL